MHLQKLLAFKIPFETVHWQVKEAEFKIACTYLIPCNLFIFSLFMNIAAGHTLSTLLSSVSIRAA